MPFDPKNGVDIFIRNVGRGFLRSIRCYNPKDRTLQCSLVASNIKDSHRLHNFRCSLKDKIFCQIPRCLPPAVHQSPHQKKIQTSCAAILLCYTIQRTPSPQILCFRNICFYTQFQDLTLCSASVAPASLFAARHVVGNAKV
jgi:hypothetical protein